MIPKTTNPYIQPQTTKVNKVFENNQNVYIEIHYLFFKRIVEIKRCICVNTVCKEFHFGVNHSLINYSNF